MKKGPLVLFAVAVVGGLFLFYYFGPGKGEDTGIKTIGIVDGIEVNISSRVPGRLEYVCCEEGEAVEADESVVGIDSAELKAAVEQAQAAVNTLKTEIAGVGSTKEQIRAEVADADAEIQVTIADEEKSLARMEEAVREMERAKDLFAEDYVAKTYLEQTIAGYDISVVEHRSARARFYSAYAQKESSTAKLATAISILGTAEARLAEAKANLHFHQTRFNDTVIKSPIEGVIIFKALGKGGMVSAGATIMTIVDIHGLFIRMDIEESKIAGITLNDKALIRVPGLADKIIKGMVSEIGPSPESLVQRNVLKGRQDIKTLRVKIKVEDPERILKPGMTVEVDIPRKG
jgi:membrane fusion protein YbhG